jgi:hypothetical protein
MKSTQIRYPTSEITNEAAESWTDCMKKAGTQATAGSPAVARRLARVGTSGTTATDVTPATSLVTATIPENSRDSRAEFKRPLLGEVQKSGLSQVYYVNRVS